MTATKQTGPVAPGDRPLAADVAAYPTPIKPSTPPPEVPGYVCSECLATMPHRTAAAAGQEELPCPGCGGPMARGDLLIAAASGQLPASHGDEPWTCTGCADPEYCEHEMGPLEDPSSMLRDRRESHDYKLGQPVATYAAAPDEAGQDSWTAAGLSGAAVWAWCHYTDVRDPARMLELTPDGVKGTRAAAYHRIGVPPEETAKWQAADIHEMFIDSALRYDPQATRDQLWEIATAARGDLRTVLCLLRTWTEEGAATADDWLRCQAGGLAWDSWYEWGTPEEHAAYRAQVRALIASGSPSGGPGGGTGVERV